MPKEPKIQIPRPPASIFSDLGMVQFQPDAVALNDFVERTLLNEKHPLYNEDHIHLTGANIGFLWTTAENKRNQKYIIGTAEKPQPQGGGWVKARQLYQLEQWFGDVPDFIITLDGNYAADCSDMHFMALLDHELYHCAPDLDMFGVPKFGEDGKMKYAIRGHDVEEFIGVVRRWGASAAGSDMVALIEAAAAAPLFSDVRLKGICGTCLRLVK